MRESSYDGDDGVGCVVEVIDKEADGPAESANDLDELVESLCDGYAGKASSGLLVQWTQLQRQACHGKDQRGEEGTTVFIVIVEREPGCNRRSRRRRVETLHEQC